MRSKNGPIISAAPPGHKIMPDSQDAEIWLDDHTYIAGGNIYTINANGVVTKYEEQGRGNNNKA